MWFTWFPQKTRDGVFAGARVFDRAFMGNEHNLLAIPFMLVAANLPLIFQHFVFHSREEAGPIVVIVLCPAIRRMVVALGAAEPRAEKDLGRSGGPRGRVSVWPEVTGSRRTVGASTS